MPSSSKIFKNVIVAGFSLYRRIEEAEAGPAAGNGSTGMPAVDREPSAAVTEDAGGLAKVAVLEKGAVPPPETRPDRKEIEEKWAAAGYARGKAKAEAECRLLREEASQIMQEAGQNLEEARRRSREIVAASEKTIVRMAVAAAENLLHCQLDLSPEKIMHVVRKTMQELPEGEAVTLYINPADLQSCRQAVENLRRERSGLPLPELLPDETLPRGSCRGETDSAIAEYSREEEQAQIEEKLMAVARAKEQQLLEEEDGEYGRH